MISNVSNQLLVMEGDLADVSTMVSVLESAGDMSGIMSAINDVRSAVDGMDIEGDPVDLSALTRIENQVANINLLSTSIADVNINVAYDTNDGCTNYAFRFYMLP